MEKRNKVSVTALLLLTNDNEILLTRRYNTGYEDGKYSLPGGHVEKGEEVREAAVREAYEELDIKIKKEDLEVVKVFDRKVKDDAYVDFILKCNNWEGSIQNKEKDKCDELKWVNKNNMPNNILPFMNELFKENGFYIPYGWEE